MIAYDPFRGRNVLVTGGLGFLGSNLAQSLVRLGARVTIVDALLEGFGGSLANVAEIRDQVDVRIADLRDTAAVETAVREQDYIFNLAAQVSHGDSMRDPQLDLALNCLATVNLLEACRKHNPAARLLYTSTRQVYGRPRRLPVDEDHPTLPVDANGINKLAAEHYHLLYDATYGIRSTVLRLTNTFGPRQQIRNNRQGFATVFLRQALKGETISLYGGGRQLRDFNYVDDVVSAMLAAITSEACQGRCFNLGAERPHSLVEFVDALRKFCDFRAVAVPFPDEQKRIDIGDYVADYSRFRAATGWRPRVALEEGLAETVAFYRRHRDVYWT